MMEGRVEIQQRQSTSIRLGFVCVCNLQFGLRCLCRHIEDCPHMALIIKYILFFFPSQELAEGKRERKKNPIIKMNEIQIQLTGSTKETWALKDEVIFYIQWNASNNQKTEY